MVKRIVFDIETRSELDVGDVGPHKYAAHPSTQVMCVGYKIDEAPTEIWFPLQDKEMPSDLNRALSFHANGAAILEAHNAEFEMCVWNDAAQRQGITSWELIRDFVSCTAARAAYRGYPRKLETLAKALRLKILKDTAGHRTMLKLSQPRSAWRKDPTVEKWHDNDIDWIILGEYCRRDVDVEYEVSKIFPELPKTERKIWDLTCDINARGLRVETGLVENVLEMNDYFQKLYTEELNQLTDFEVMTAGQNEVFLNWLTKNGCEIENLQKQTILDKLREDNPPKIKRALELRQLLGKSSMGKFVAFKNRWDDKGIIRDLLVYGGAVPTMRWTGSGIQPQNFPRGTIKDTESIRNLISIGDPELVDLVYKSPLEAFSSCLRNMIIPHDGYDFECADFAQIETRALFWLADEKSGINAFKNGEDLYKQMAAAIFKKDINEITPEERFVGKESVLGCLAKGTDVLTPSGLKKIETIKKTDKLWDGVEWIDHEGLLQKGLKTVIKIKSLDISVTPDHWVLTPKGWLTAGEIVTLGVTLPQPLEQKTGELKLYPQNLSQAQNAVSLCAAYAEMKKNYGLINFTGESLSFARNALNLLMGKGVEERETAISFLTLNLERVGLHVSTTLGKDVTTLLIKTSQTMAVAAFQHPLKPPEIFWNTLLHSMGLISPTSRWTELIMTEGMNREILESFLNPETTEIVETFDIKNAGPRNRFQAGKALVHNCGYGMGAKKFVDQCLQKNTIIPFTLGKLAVDTYRRKYVSIAGCRGRDGYWQKLEKACLMAVKFNRAVKCGRVIASKRPQDHWMTITLPSGRPMYYPEVKISNKETPWGEMKATLSYWGVNSKTKQWAREHTYGGKIAENICQGVSRDLMALGMLNCEGTDYLASLTVHDELLSQRKKKDAQRFNNEVFVKRLTALPKWADGFPMKAEGWSGPRYRK